MRATDRTTLSTADALLAAAGPLLLLVVALEPSLRPAGAPVVVPAWILLRLAQRPSAIAWAAVLPLVVVLAWPWVAGADVPIGDPACRDPFSGIALRRLVVAVAGAALVATMAFAHHGTREELGLGRPSRPEALVAVGGGLVLVIAGLWIGPLVAEPFFGELDFPVPATALVPALIFGVANGLLEELLYRGALQAWLGRLVPIGIAIAFQGVIFGIVHVGPEVVTLVPVHVALLSGVGIAAGLALAVRDVVDPGRHPRRRGRRPVCRPGLSHARVKRPLRRVGSSAHGRVRTGRRTGHRACRRGSRRRRRDDGCRTGRDGLREQHGRDAVEPAALGAGRAGRRDLPRLRPAQAGLLGTVPDCRAPAGGRTA
jgi:membrane protease YdiL (CAAX protease family)